MRLPRVCKTYQLLAWTPSWIYQILSNVSATSLGCYKDDVCNSRFSKISILHANPCSLLFSGKIFLYFCNKLPFWRPFCLHSYLNFKFVIEAKCLQLDSNFIANNLRGKWVWDIFSISHNFFTYNWPPSWTPSWIYQNAQWCQSGITRIFQGQYMHYQNQQRKKFKIKFQVLLKFAQILLDYMYDGQ